MKKYLIMVLFLIFGTAIVSAEDTDNFINALKNCSSYSGGGNVQMQGLNVQSSKRILGYQNEKCIYEEKISFMDESTTVTCRFSKPQIDELTEVMNAYNTVRKYTNENVDTSGPDAVANNPIVKAWAKYLQDPSVCEVK